MEFDFGKSVGVLVAITAVATVGLTSVMAPGTVFMMVLPSMVVFAVVAFFLGMKHGEYRTAR
ncbi:hypothetical protein DU500_06460 [Haloplanus rubicundus]|uniref:Uncharacterized protein n=1 Tax=Haloplanus rubicundus TaxID=1547898 RepID=A0A345EB87_9EURY|nr:hypothetical protein [Haloplanus rubicundus]AXG06114.1 hypothetical protein DU500_06460 [Haloplanus rubicundus]AXG09459.1 hypothetical protein DU484_06000 [Haloplanus rubicundus]